MKLLIKSIIFLLLASNAGAEVIDVDNGNALAIFGTGCEDIKAEESMAATRLKASDKAAFNAVSSVKEIINIKDSFDDHDFNVMIYNIVDEHIEDMTAKTVKKDNIQVCVEVSGFITPESIGIAIDNTIKNPIEEQKSSDLPTTEKDNTAESVSEAFENENTQSDTERDTQKVNIATATVQATKPSKELLQIPEKSQINKYNSNVVVLSVIYVKPTEFYNNTQSTSHSNILKKVLEQSDQIKIVDNADEANFIVTPKVLKAKVEPINAETSRMQMVVAIETFDKNKNTTTTEHQNKFVLFNNEDDEQKVARALLSQLFDLCGNTTISIAEKSSEDLFNQHHTNIVN